ncbi:MAG TPA: tetratricopeptide repeat protein [Vicinamibacteria bacterium]|nr:tetratricopeptide repeat protein [Vicinamibacteria bacterium]
MRASIALLAAVLLPALAAADEVLLKGGGKVSGRIVSRSEAKIEVDVGAGRITVPASSVLRIEEGRSPLHEYEERAGRLAAADVEGWLALGEWASARGLGTQAREAYNRALAASPGDPRANAALGNVQMDGRWMSEDESYRARGYVQHEGEWITTAERDAIERERAAEAERDRERRAADSRVREAEARAEEAEARAKEAEAKAEESSDGLPLWYAWGGGPTYWPSGPVVAPPRPSQPIVRPR